MLIPKGQPKQDWAVADGGIVKQVKRFAFETHRFQVMAADHLHANNAPRIEAFFLKLLDANAYPRAICRGYHF